jgi:hypothetical protein
MNTIPVRSWMRKYGSLGVLMAACYVFAYELLTRRRLTISVQDRCAVRYGGCAWSLGGIVVRKI